jgi:hypothetical protein
LNRKELGFESAESRQFHFLVSANGFRCTHRSTSRVGFESEKVCIKIDHGLKDYEVGIGFGRTGVGETFNFRFCGASVLRKETQLEDCTADTPENVDQVAQKLADVFQTVGTKIADRGP